MMDKLAVWARRNYMFKSEKYGYLLYAGNSNSFFKITSELFECIQRYRDGDGSSLDQEVIDRFVNAGVLLLNGEESFDNVMKMSSIYTKSSLNVRMITIAPTLDCNFRCAYCYEKHTTNKTYISKEILDAFINSMIAAKKPHLDITWYGGEPLLALDKMQYLVAELDRNEINVNYSIVANGYLITDEVLEHFEKCNMKFIQITIDGSEEIHNKRRPHFENDDSYEVIMSNIDKLYSFYLNKPIKPRVAIRVNVDNHNKQDFSTIYNQFKSKYGDFFSVYSAFVKESNSCLTEWSCEMDEAKRKDFLISTYKKDGVHNFEFLPNRLGYSYCQAQTFNNYVMDPVGNLYQCWDDVGMSEKVVANITENTIRNPIVLSDYIIKSDPFNNAICLECMFFFTCRGGCPRKRLDDMKQAIKTNCPLIKKNLNEFLEYRYEIQSKCKAGCKNEA